VFSTETVGFSCFLHPRENHNLTIYAKILLGQGEGRELVSFDFALSSVEVYFPYFYVEGGKGFF